MPHKIKLFILVFYVFSHSVYAENKLHPAITQPIEIQQLQEYEQYPAVVKELINSAMKLSQQNLTYLYGSADPKNGGMDCSGTIYYLLNLSTVNLAPRSSYEMYQWVLQKGKFYPANNAVSFFELAYLKPGDLLFWSGTYKTKQQPSISHVMLYLGKNQQGQPLMFGASDGRTYQGKSLWGVSLFDFLLPRSGSTAKFVGYSCIPDLTCGLEAKGE